MSVVLRDDNHKYFLDWNKTTNELLLTEWDYVHIGSSTKLQIAASYSVGMGLSGAPIYGSWYDDANQTTTANTATAMYCGHGTGNGITKAYGSNFEVDYAGTYNIQFSVQLDQSSGAGHHIYIWFRKNGVDIPYSASEVAIQGSLAESIPSWNFIVDMNAGDYINVMYKVDNAAVYLKAVAPNTIPGIPSVIITMWKL
jgi:hypothetical protein